MRDARIELLDQLRYVGKSIRDIVFADLKKIINGEETILQTCNIQDIEDFLDYEYINGVSENILFGIISFSDGSCFERVHEGGYEEWYLKK